MTVTQAVRIAWLQNLGVWARKTAQTAADARLRAKESDMILAAYVERVEVAAADLAAYVDRRQWRYCLGCAEWHTGECLTVREVTTPPPSEYHRSADRFPTRAPDGPFRQGGRKHR